MSANRPAEVPLRNQADIEAFEQAMPLSARVGSQSTYEIIAKAGAEFGHRIALTFLPGGTAAEEPVHVSYADLLANVNRAANLFHCLGIRPGRAVSYLLPNLPETQYTIWGGEAAGIVNAINPLLNPKQIAEIIEAAESDTLVTLGPVQGSDIWDKAQSVRKLVPGIRNVIVVGAPAGEPGLIDFHEALAAQPGDRLISGRVIRGDEICSYFHTGGTTGSPKLARHIHSGEVYEAWAIATLTEYSQSDVILLGLPLFHVNAVIVSSLAPFMRGAEVVLLSATGYRNPNVMRDFWKIVARYRGTTFSGVPTIYAALLNVPMQGLDVSSLRFGICGAAPMPVELFRSFERATGIRILEGYGMTEGTCASSFNPLHGESRIGSVGLRFPYQQMKVAKLNDAGQFERDCKPGEVGVVLMNGPNVFPGYKQEKFNATAFAAPGWLNSGDLARRDEDGYFWLVGRAKDLIIRGGHNIDPGQVEEVLHQHPAVGLAAVVGRPDEYAGEIPVAYVELKPNANATADEIREFAAARVPERPAAPAEVFLIERMPVTAVGKIFKPELRYDIIARVLKARLAAIPGGAGVNLTVGPHDSHGTMARFRIVAGDAAMQQAIAALMANFAIRFEVVEER